VRLVGSATARNPPTSGGEDVNNDEILLAE